jgi:hypothetical protein
MRDDVELVTVWLTVSIAVPPRLDVLFEYSLLLSPNGSLACSCIEVYTYRDVKDTTFGSDLEKIASTYRLTRGDDSQLCWSF